MRELPVVLKPGERKFLKAFLRSGTRKARAIARANILLLADRGYATNEISEALNVHRQRVWRVKQRYAREGLETALGEKPRSGQPKKYGEKHEAEIIATACTNPPAGSKRWSIELLTEALRKRSGFSTLNRESVRLVLKKAKRSLG